MALLGLSDNMPFGKNKGKNIKALIQNDPGWLCWLRDQRRSEGKASGFEKAVHDLLDKEIEKSAVLKKNYKPWNSREEASFVQLAGRIEEDAIAKSAEELETERLVVAYSGQWGSW